MCQLINASATPAKVKVVSSNISNNGLVQGCQTDSIKGRVVVQVFVPTSQERTCAPIKERVHLIK